MKRYPSYKKSKLPELGEVPKHWEEKKAKYFFHEVDERSKIGDELLLSVSHITGVTPRQEKDVTMFMAESYEGAKICQFHDLVINIMWAWMAALGISRYQGIVSPSYSVYRQRNPNYFNFSYLNYLLRTPEYVAEYNRRSKGIQPSRWRIYPNDFLQIPIICPPLHEQNQIADFLNRKSRQVEQFVQNRKRLIRLLDLQKFALISQAVTNGIASSVQMKDSGVEELGKIPAHWTTLPMKKACSLIKDGLHQIPPKVDHGIPIVSTQHIRDRKISLDNVTYISLENYHLGHPRVAPEAGDVFITLVGSIGFTAILEKNHLPISCTRHVGYVRPTKQLLAEFLLNYFESNTFKKWIENNVSQVAQPSIYLRVLEKHVVPIPPIIEQELIVQYLNEEISKIDKASAKAQSEIDLILEYKTALISNAVSGKINLQE